MKIAVLGLGMMGHLWARQLVEDLRLALETAAGFSLSLEQTARLKKTYSRGMAAGWQEDDFIGLIRAVENVPRSS